MSNQGWSLYEKIGKPKYIVAPMVEASELAWRMLCRQYGAQLCYTPMFHAKNFANDKKYRKVQFSTCDEDRPLIVQFCANDPDILLEACKLVVGQCDAVDLNLGCPQVIAREGHYGAFLQDEWELIESMVSRIHKELPELPITCKIRRFEDRDRTIAYAKMLQNAGCSMLTVHGRTREMKGRLTGVADWTYIKDVKAAVSIPVFANGNINYFEDVKKCLDETGADGVMTAEGNLHNPAIFSGANPPVWQMASEYLDMARKYPCELSCARGHLFKILHHAIQLPENHHLREFIAKGDSLDDFQKVPPALQEKYQNAEDCRTLSAWEEKCGFRPIAVWRCQPYVRPDPSNAQSNVSQTRDSHKEYQKLLESTAALKRPIDVDLSSLSKNKLKKMKRNPNKCFNILNGRQNFVLCKTTDCKNPKGEKCEHEFCRTCCRKAMRERKTNCEPHHALYAAREPRTTETLESGLK